MVKRASVVISTAAMTSAPSFDTATEVLEAIVTGGDALQSLKRYLTTHDVQDSRFSVEAWAGVCQGSHDEAELCAFAARMAVVDSFVEVPLSTPLPEWAAQRLPELLAGSSHRTSYAAFGDEYIASILKMKLPALSTVCTPRGSPAYTKAAQVFKEAVNDVVRPLLQTSLKHKLLHAQWDTYENDVLVAAVVTMREMIRAPELYIDSDGAAADPEVPCIFIRRAVHGGSAAAVGVLHNNILTVVSRPVDALALWLVKARDTHEAVDGLLDALELKDTRSSTAKSIVTGRTALAKAAAERQETL